MANDIHRRVLDSDTGVELLVLDGSPVTVGLTAPKASMALDRTNSEAWLSQGAGAWTKFGLGSVSWASITGKPTDVAGFGITDVYTKTQSDSRYVDVTGDAMSGALTIATTLVTGGSVSFNGDVDGFYAWNMQDANTTRDISGGQYPAVMNSHTGWSFTSHDNYGGFRIWAQGYPVLWTGAYMIAQFTAANTYFRSTNIWLGNASGANVRISQNVLYFGASAQHFIYAADVGPVTYGTFRIGGARAGYSGFYYDDWSYYVMQNATNHGLYHASYGWRFRFSGSATAVQWDLFDVENLRPTKDIYINYANYGYGLVGVYASTIIQAVFTMGDSYRLGVGGTLSANFYGMGWSYDVPSGGGVNTGYTLYHGLGVFGANVLRSYVGYGIWTSGLIRAETYLSAGTFVRAGTYFYADQNYGYGLVGLYDATKYRAVYIMGGSFLPPVDGSALTGMYGIFFAYDATSGGKNVTGLSYSHGFGNVANGTVYNFFGAAGTWIGTPLYVSGTGRFTGAVTMDAALSVGTTLTVTSTIVGQAHVWAYGGVLYLASSGTKYLYWDGTTFNLVGGYLTAGSGLYVPSYFDTTARQLIGTWTVISGSFIIPAAGIFYLDGGGDTYLYEVSANAIRLVAGGALGLQVTSSYILIQPTSKFYLDGGGDTYAYESSANVIDFYAGGSQSVRMAAASGTLYGAWAITGALTLSSSLSVAAITATGDITATADVKVTGAVTQKRGTSTYYDTLTTTVSTSSPPGSSSGYPTGHQWVKVTAPI